MRGDNRSCNGGVFGAVFHVPKGLATLCSFFLFFLLSLFPFPAGKPETVTRETCRFPPPVRKNRNKANLSSWTRPRDNTRIRANLSTIRNATDSFRASALTLSLSLSLLSLRFRSPLPYGKMSFPTPVCYFPPVLFSYRRK